ncbi:MAG: sugar ABC transporter permease [Alphaproteobacteria bacterium]|nr:sugar ABC transporter permease [Alphaproteobacteria bacterium]
MKSGNLLGLGFMSPALVMVVAFFLAPVILTIAFAFTNMSTATGITGGFYEVTPTVLTRLKDQSFDPALIEKLGNSQYVISESGLESLANEGQFADLAKEMKTNLLGQSFKDRRSLERAIKKLKNKPRKIRDVKLAAEHFKQSILNTPYETEIALQSALSGIDLTLQKSDFDVLKTNAYTGWTWTTQNFEIMFDLPATWRIAGNTLLYVTATLSFNVIFGLFLAISTFYLPALQASTFRTIWFLPRILPPVIYILMWKWMTWDTGFIANFLAMFGVPPKNWMLDTNLHAWVVIILINGFVGASMGMILFSSAIRAIPASLLYASEVDGASRWQQVRHIILPQLRWPILFITSYQTLSLLTSFEFIYLSTDGGPGKATEVWALSAFHAALNNYGGNLQYGYGAALALVLVIIGISASLLYLRLFNFKELVSAPKIEQ